MMPARNSKIHNRVASFPTILIIMQRRDFLITLGATAGMLMMPQLASEAMARSKAHPEQWRGFNLLNYFTAGHPEPFR
jgi:hypothetical protein